jgi:hypothetical protein
MEVREVMVVVPVALEATEAWTADMVVALEVWAAAATAAWAVVTEEWAVVMDFKSLIIL